MSNSSVVPTSMTRGPAGTICVQCQIVTGRLQLNPMPDLGI
ncbi:MAG: hypothetical protein ACWA49_02695 [Ruegeria sp.]